MNHFLSGKAVQPRQDQVVFRLLFSAFTILLLGGCMTYKAFDNALLGDKPLNNDTYIILKSGQKITGSRIVFPKDPGTRAAHTGKRNGCWYGWDSWMGIDDKKFPKDSVCAYQEGGTGYIYSGCTKARRIRAGKLNFYYYQRIYNDEPFIYYVFEKSEEKCNAGLIVKDVTEFYHAISDNPEAARLCKKYFPDMKRSQTNETLRKLLEIVETYNR